MKTTTGKKFTAYWDRVIRDWASGSTPIVDASQQCWFNLWYNYFTEWLMPEPYWGDPDNCSIVILNFNPKGVKNPQKATTDMCHFDNRNDKNTVCGLMQGCYSDVAKKFPHLDQKLIPPFDKYKGTEWWQDRNVWLNKLLGYAGIALTKRPFAVELCGWHSSEWDSSWKTSDVKDYLDNFLIPVLENSILKSDMKIGVCPWKGIADALMEKFGYKNVSGDYQLSGYPLIDGYFQPLNRKKRRYIVLKKEDVVVINEEGAEEKKDVYIIATWGARGQVPTKDFKDFENDLIKAVRASIVRPSKKTSPSKP